ncbi:Uncharacterised protein [Vibrio cholerae]|nr:Uncharacterised protein [Vibrio cholerae]
MPYSCSRVRLVTGLAWLTTIAKPSKASVKVCRVFCASLSVR